MVDQNDGVLPDDVFAGIVRATPLVSIDLIVSDADGRVLLGLRNFEPAKGSLFVPGGRIRKDETIDAAFARLCRAELGVAARIEDAEFAGVFEHFYDVARFGPGSTHYVVLAYKLKLARASSIKGDEQHAKLVWTDVDDLLARPDVHRFTRDYFAKR